MRLPLFCREGRDGLALVALAAGVSAGVALTVSGFVLMDGWTEQSKPLPEPTPIERIVAPKGSDVVAYFIVGVDPPDPSERVNIYLPKSLITRADKRAAEHGMSRSSFFGFAVAMALDAPLGYWRTVFAQPRSKAHKTGPVRAKKRPGKKSAR